MMNPARAILGSGILEELMHKLSMHKNCGRLVDTLIKNCGNSIIPTNKNCGN